MSILPALEHELRRAADRRLAPAHEPPAARRRTTLQPLLIAAASVIAIAVAVGALVALGHRQRPAAGDRVTTTTSARTPRSELLAALGVLRRPQSASALHAAPAHLLGLGPSGPSDPRLIRSLVRVVPGPGDAAVQILPTSYRRSRPARARTVGLNLSITLPNGSGAVTSRATSIAELLAHGAALCATAHGRNLCAVVVPDGVARVTIGAVRQANAPLSLSDPRVLRSTATVHDNVATFTLPSPRASSRRLPSHLYLADMTTGMSWLGGDGHALAQTTVTMQVTVRVGRSVRIPPPDQAIPDATQCAVELNVCRATLEPRRARRRH